MSEFCFSLTTKRRDNAEKLLARANTILTELQEPKDKGTELFELSETKDSKWSIGCVCYYLSAKVHEQALKQVVTEFPEIKIIYQESESGSDYFYEAVTRNGQLVKIESWEVAVNTADKDDFTRIVEYLKDHVEETIWLKEDSQWAKWSYDHLTEEDDVQQILQKLSSHFPETTIRCVKYNIIDFAYGDEIACYAKFCGSEIEWQNPEPHISEEDIENLCHKIHSMWKPVPIGQ
jgi:carotenoid cleavage dioxygenase-like enzyme